MNNPTKPPLDTEDSYPALPVSIRYLFILVIGYIGVYLCRKNLGVAIPLIQEDLNVDKAQVGIIASVSTIAYAIGKVFWGPLVDRIGGKIGFLTSLTLVAIFCGLGGFAPTLGALVWMYSLNRFSGSGGWSGMVKQMPDWFPLRLMGKSMAVLSLSFVVGGVFAAFLAGEIALWSNGNWRAVMGFPALVLLVIIIICAIMLPNPGKTSDTPETPSDTTTPLKKPEPTFALISLVTNRMFLVVCGLSFTLTLMRETFGTWSVDFLESLKTGDLSPESVKQSARLSALFDSFGFLGIILMGWVYDFLNDKTKRITLASLLGLLAIALLSINRIGENVGVVSAAWMIGAVGFLSYGPYSLLSGVMAVEIAGKGRAATVASWVDAVGYVAAILAGAGFGSLVDKFGYKGGFQVLAGLMIVSAVLSLFIGGGKKSTEET